MEDKSIVITGANSGIGFETAKALAQRGARVLMVCKDTVKGKAALKTIADLATGGRPELYIADLASQAQTRRLAQDIRNCHDGLDVLINNAGAAFSPKRLSEDGVEMTFAINYLAPFLLTNLLLELLLRASSARIVNVVTEVYPSKLRFDNLQGEKRYHFLLAYMHSKLANVVFTNELSQRLLKASVTANSFSPGPAVTNFGKQGLTGLASFMPKVMMKMPLLCERRERVTRASTAGLESGVYGGYRALLPKRAGD